MSENRALNWASLPRDPGLIWNIFKTFQTTFSRQNDEKGTKGSSSESLVSYNPDSSDSSGRSERSGETKLVYTPEVFVDEMHLFRQHYVMLSSNLSRTDPSVHLEYIPTSLGDLNNPIITPYNNPL